MGYEVKYVILDLKENEALTMRLGGVIDKCTGKYYTQWFALFHSSYMLYCDDPIKRTMRQIRRYNVWSQCKKVVFILDNHSELVF